MRAPMGPQPHVATESTSWQRQAAAAALLLGLAFFAYIPAMQADFIWDDNLLLTNYGPMLADDGLQRFWGSLEAPDYYPLTWSSLWIEMRLWGGDFRHGEHNAAGYHITNVAMHAIGALLLWRVLRRLRVPGAWLAATVFAVHPVTVASVGWISERKNVLSLIFYLLTILWFLRMYQSEQPGRRWTFFGLSLLAYVLGLISKTSIVSIPVVLMLCLWYLEGNRLWKPAVDAAPDEPRWFSTPAARWSLVLLPFMALSLAAGVLTMYTQQHTVIGDTIIYAPHEHGPWRLALAGISPWFYLWKLVVPQPLLMIYPRWDFAVTKTACLPGIAMVAGLAALVWYSVKGRAWARVCLIVALYFLALIIPVTGLLGDMYFHKHSLVADHLQYLAMIGPIALAIGAGALLARRLGQAGMRAGMVLGAVLVVALVAKTWQQSRYYENQRTLWEYNLHHNPDAWMACYNLGTVLATEANAVSDPAEHKELLKWASTYFQHAIKVQPDWIDSYNNYGLVLMSLGDEAQAERMFREGIRQKPMETPLGHRNLGMMLARQGRIEEAISVYETCNWRYPNSADSRIELAVIDVRLGYASDAAALLDEVIAKIPQHVPALLKRSSLRSQLGQLELAEQDAREALKLQDVPETRFGLGVALESRGKVQEALDQYLVVLGLQPGNPMAHYRAGMMLARLNKPHEAIQHYVNTAGIAPDFVEVYGNLGLLLAQQGDLANALKYYRKALELNPNWVEVQMDYARLLVATDDPAVRNVELSLQLAQKAVQLSGGHWACLETLALAQAEAGQFEQAQASARAAMEAALRAGDMQSLTKLDRLIQMFKAGKTPRTASRSQPS